MHTTYDVNLYHRTENTTIKIHEDGDGTGMVVVKVDTDYFGKIDFSMDATDAKVFAEGILKQVEFITKRLTK